MMFYSQTKFKKAYCLVTKDYLDFYEDENCVVLIFQLLRKSVQINSIGIKTINRENNDKQKEDINIPIKKKRERILTDWSESKLHQIEEEKSDESSNLDGRSSRSNTPDDKSDGKSTSRRNKRSSYMTGELKPIMAPQVRRLNRNTLYKSKPDVQTKEKFEIFELMYSISSELRPKFYTLGIEVDKASKWINAFEMYRGSRIDEISIDTPKSNDSQSIDARSRVNTVKTSSNEANVHSDAKEMFDTLAIHSNSKKLICRSNPGSIKKQVIDADKRNTLLTQSPNIIN